MSQLPTAKIVERTELSNDLWIIKLQTANPFSFKPGQYITIGTNNIERPYSIVSAPHESLVELFIELVPDGELTPLLYEMHEGATVSIRPRAKGLFTFDPNYSHHLMIGTVTGTVPYISILRDYFFHNGTGHKFFLLEGASYQDEFGYGKELQAMAREHRNTLVYVPTVSRPNEDRNQGWTGATGRVNLIVEEYIKEMELPKSNTLIYACGHPGMIEDLKEKLARKDWAFKEERFWKEDA